MLLNYWVRPDGTLHSLPLWGHAEFAKEYLNSFDPDQKVVDGNRAVEELHNRGWLRIKTLSERSTTVVIVESSHHVTKSIIDAIYGLYVETGSVELKNWLRENHVELA